jgi:Domain of unknown function (DUF6894)
MRFNQVTLAGVVDLTPTLSIASPCRHTAVPDPAAERIWRAIFQERARPQMIIPRPTAPGDDMPSFFFHLTNGDRFPDDRATPCRTLEEAKTFALGVAAELGRNRPSNEIEHLVVCVTDESGNEVFRTKGGEPATSDHRRRDAERGTVQGELKNYRGRADGSCRRKTCT